MNDRFEKKLDEMFGNIVSHCRKTSSAYKGFLTMLCELASMVDENPRKILTEAHGNCDRRLDGDSIERWLHEFAPKWKERTRGYLIAASARSKKQALIDRLGLTDEDMKTLGIEQ